MSTYPISTVCPQCGSTDYSKGQPRSFWSLEDDRICKSCNTRYTPPSPRMALFLSVVGFFAGWLTILPLERYLGRVNAGLGTDEVAGVLTALVFWNIGKAMDRNRASKNVLVDSHSTGGKTICPRCGSTDVRRLSDLETAAFCGGQFVLMAARRCNQCKNRWQPVPGTVGCYLMIVLAAAGLAIGAGLIGGGLILFVLMFRFAGAPTGLGPLVVCLVIGSAVVLGLVRGIDDTIAI